MHVVHHPLRSALQDLLEVVPVIYFLEFHFIPYIFFIVFDVGTKTILKKKKTGKEVGRSFGLVAREVEHDPRMGLS